MDLRNKIVDLKQLQKINTAWKTLGKKVVFTNGCFDIIHQGHLHILRTCKNLGDKLIVGLNADSSVKKLKGTNRPIKDEATRAELLASLTYVDALVIFEEQTPQNLIENLQIDILAKGGDYKKNEIIGAEFVEKNGGSVAIIPFLSGFSSTNLINKMKTD